MIGNCIHALAKSLWHFNRSITGDGVRNTLKELTNIIPDLRTHEVASGEQVFDWTIPEEWRVREAYIITPSGKKICDFRENNLHLVGYSIPVNKRMDLSELNKFLYSLPDQPNAIPYITSYYKKRWDANSTSKCDTRLCRLTVLFEYLDRLPESETFPRS